MAPAYLVPFIFPFGTGIYADIAIAASGHNRTLFPHVFRKIDKEGEIPAITYLINI